MQSELKVKFKPENLRSLIYTMLSVFLICFFAAGIIFTVFNKTNFNILTSLYKRGYVMIYIWAYIFLMAIIYALKDKIYACSRGKLLFLIFLIALFPRLLLLSQRYYILSSDFKCYYDMGVHLAAGDKEFVRSLISQYQIPKFGGLACWEAVVAKLFSEKLIGFQLANIIMSSLICVFIYLCVENYSKRGGIIAAILFAVYPANIVSSQVNTNHHGAVLFTLIGAYLLTNVEHADGVKKVILAVLSGIAFAFSDFWHPSVIVPIIAVICYGVMGCFEKNRWDFSRIRYCIYTVVIYALVINIGISCFKNMDIVSSEIKQASSSNLAKIVVGFNEQTGGGYSEDDYKTFKNLSENERKQWFMQKMQERILQKSPGEVIKFISQKAGKVWFVQDSYFWWYYGGYQTNIKNEYETGRLSADEYQQKSEQLTILSSYALFDWIFLGCIYILGIIGLIAQVRKNNSIELFLWMLLGWILIHLIIEVQARYRYLGMPYIFILAGIGTEYVYLRRFNISVKITSGVNVLKQKIKRGK